MATCSQCSQALPDDSRFCIHCGQPVVISQPSVLTCAPAPPPPVAVPAAIPAPAPPPVVAAKSGSSKSVVLGVVSALAVLALAVRSYWSGLPAPPVASASPSTTASPAPTARVALMDLGELADTWSVDPADPAYSSGSKRDNELVLSLQGSELKGTGPENSPFRFWAEGEQIVGEAHDPEGKLHKLRWEWLEGRSKARLHLVGGVETHTLTLRRGPAPEPQAPEPPKPQPLPTLYELQSDLNGDGSRERAVVVALDGNPEPNAPSRKALRIYDSAGNLQFESEPFEEPFHTDLDSTAEHAQEKAGLHLVETKSYPRIRLIFTTRSGNFVDFRFDGQGYVLAEVGD